MGKLSKKYGFFTAVSMVIGIVIGSGVFKSAGSVLGAAGGDFKIAILAWVVGGVIMIASAYSFSLLAVRLDNLNGVNDFIEKVAGRKMGYIVEWFMTFIYYPSLASIVAWLAGSVTANLLGFNDTINGLSVWLIALFYLGLTYLLSFLSPILAGKWQISATVIKLIPLALIALLGIIIGSINGNIVEAINIVPVNSPAGSLAKAVAVTIFAYDGWIMAMSISSELKDSKKNLSKALVIGSLVVVVGYLLFFIGISGVIENAEAINLSGNLDVSVIAAKRLFGSFLGSSVSVLILISVLGTLNGIVMASMRGMYTISSKGSGPGKDFFSRVSKHDVPNNSGYISIVATLFWGLIWFANFNGYFNGFMDTSILPIVFIYAFYLLVYIYIIFKVKDLGFISRYVAPTIAALGSLYLIYGAFTSDETMFMYFSCIVVVIIVVGVVTYSPKSRVS